jgi:hypothetical protein
MCNYISFTTLKNVSLQEELSEILPIINLHMSLCKIPVILFVLQSSLKFPDKFSKNAQILNFTQIPSVGV